MLTDNELLAFHIKSAQEQSAETSDDSSSSNRPPDMNANSSSSNGPADTNATSSSSNESADINDNDRAGCAVASAKRVVLGAPGFSPPPVNQWIERHSRTS